MMTLPYKLIAAITALSLLLLGLWAWQKTTYRDGYNAGVQNTQELWNKEKTIASSAAASAQAKASQDSLTIANQQQEIIRAAIKQKQSNAEHARGYDAAASSMLDYAQHTSGCSDRAHTDSAAPAPGGPASAPTSDLQYQLLEWYAIRAGELARTADESHAAATACERSYDSVIDLLAGTKKE